MDIFVLVKDTRYDTKAENDVKTFTDLEEAKKELQEMCETYRRDAKEDGWYIDVDDSLNFEAYYMGYECENHYYFNIHTFSV